MTCRFIYGFHMKFDISVRGHSAFAPQSNLSGLFQAMVQSSVA
jgi:hypothetical protein